MGGVRPVSQNPYLICDQNLRFSVHALYLTYDLTKHSIPYLRPDQTFDTLFKTRGRHSCLDGFCQIDYEDLSIQINLSVQIKFRFIHSTNLKKAGVGQPKYCNNAYVHVVLTNLCSIFSIL